MQTIEEKKKYILDYFYSKFNKGQEAERDEFTNEIKTLIEVDDWIDFKVDDVMFGGIHSRQRSQILELSLANIEHQAEQVLANYRNDPNGYSSGPLYDDLVKKAKSAVLADKQSALDKAIKMAKDASKMRVKLYIGVDVKNAQAEYFLFFKFNNASHPRNLKGMRILIKTVEGERKELSMKLRDFQQSDDDVYDFVDEVSYYATEEDVRILTTKGNRVSLRFDDMNVDGTVEDRQDAADKKEHDKYLEIVKEQGLQAAVKAYQDNHDSKFEKEGALETIDMWIGWAGIDTDSMENIIPLVRLYVETMSEVKESTLTENDINLLYDFCEKEEEKSKEIFNEWMERKKETDKQIEEIERQKAEEERQKADEEKRKMQEKKDQLANNGGCMTSMAIVIISTLLIAGGIIML